MKFKRKALKSGKRSKFEEQCHLLLEGWSYEKDKLRYTTPASEHTYTPDFSKKGTKTIIEAKGRFRSSEEAKKYLAIRDSNQGYRIVFLLQNPSCPMPNAKRRKDGTIRTMADWCDANSFDWVTLHTLPDNLK
jgi:hypothetical protein